MATQSSLLTSPLVLTKLLAPPALVSPATAWVKPTSAPCPRNSFQRGHSFLTTTGQCWPGVRRQQSASCFFSSFARPEKWHKLGVEACKADGACRRCWRPPWIATTSLRFAEQIPNSSQASRRQDRKNTSNSPARHNQGPHFVAFSGEAQTRAVAVSP